MAASLSNSTAGSPPPLAPAPNMQSPIQSSPSTPGAPALVTRKEWIIPPRPKPGRKPAQDTPPTKRKAQNRAAQRAFRERRAAKVGELEGSIKEIEEEYEKSQEGLRAKIARLEAEADDFRQQLLAWQRRCDALAHDLTMERRARYAVEGVFGQQRQQQVKAEAVTNGTDAVSLRLPQATSRYELSSTTMSQSQAAMDQSQQYDESVPELMGCGNCTIDTRCACIEQAINMPPSSLSGPDQREILNPVKRPHSPEEARRPSPTKRSRSIHPSDHGYSPLETDFTAMYANPKTSLPPVATSMTPSALPTPLDTGSTSMSNHANDRCGFCEDGTACLCAELDSHNKDTAQNHETSDQINSPGEEGSTRLAPILAQYTPPPSDDNGDANHSSESPRASRAQTQKSRSLPSITNRTGTGDSTASKPNQTSSSNSCINGPGTCAQCLRDPNSTLFCKSLAAVRSSQAVSSSNPSGCCGGKSSSGGCCRDQPSSNSRRPSDSVSQPQSPADTKSSTYLNPPLLSCADTYTTLSRHPHYAEASSELGTWLGRLRTTPDRATVQKNNTNADPEKRPSNNGRADAMTAGEESREGRTAMEVEAASVMGVLRLFDRRFGRGQD